MKKTIHILVLMFIANIMFGQDGLQINSIYEIEKDEKNIVLNQSIKSNVLLKKADLKAPVDLKNFILSKNASNNSSSFLMKKSDTELAFFCKIESEIQQASKIPLKFRLGEVQAVDRKEGKWKQFEQ